MGWEGSDYLVLEVMDCDMADRAMVSRVMAQPGMAGDMLPEARIMEAATNPTSLSRSSLGDQGGALATMRITGRVPNSKVLTGQRLGERRQ